MTELCRASKCMSRNFSSKKLLPHKLHVHWLRRFCVLAACCGANISRNGWNGHSNGNFTYANKWKKLVCIFWARKRSFSWLPDTFLRLEAIVIGQSFAQHVHYRVSMVFWKRSVLATVSVIKNKWVSPSDEWKK